MNKKRIFIITFYFFMGIFICSGGNVMGDTHNQTDRAPYYQAKTIKFLAMDKINPGVGKEKIKPHLKAEAQHAWKLYKSGVFREIYFRMDQPGVVVILECTSIHEAKKILNDLPLVKEGLITFDTIIPLGPFIPFAELFEKK